MTDRILFGAAYYPEYTPDRPVIRDLDLMQAAGMNLIRVGESVWSTWEPRDGEFDLDWLQETLDEAHARGIQVVLGTPTYAVPMWLAKRYPEIAAVDGDGGRVPWGRRQEMDFTNATYLRYAERVIRAVIGRYATHPAVIGYQVDNEPGLRLLQNAAVVDRFVAELEQQYGDVDAFNEAWGMTHWSHRLSEWSELWGPTGNVHPQYDFAWREFQTRLTSEFINWQASLVRELAAAVGRDDQFVTTCVAYDLPAVDELEVNRGLDVAAGNPYFPPQDDMVLPAPDEIPDRAWMVSGTWNLVHLSDRMFASKQAPFLVTETNAWGLGDSTVNLPAWDGQWRQAAWAMVARGARMVEYWHWNSLHSGSEMSYLGVLPHDQQPGRFYAEVAKIGAEFEAASEVLDGLQPDAQIGLLYSVPSKWALSFQPPWVPENVSFSFFSHYERAYERLVGTYARAAFDAGLSTRVLHDRQLLSTGIEPGWDPAVTARRLPVLLVPGYYAADDAVLQWLQDYAGAGGHLVVGIRTAYADSSARARTDVKPAVISTLAGAHYQESSGLDAPVALRATPAAHLAGFVVPGTAAGRHWVDCLMVDSPSTKVLAEYQHPFFGKYPAITSTIVGAGRITLVGTELDAETATALVDWATRHAEANGDASTVSTRRWGGAAAVRVLSGVNAAGQQVYVVHNWSWVPAQVTIPVHLKDVLSPQRFVPGNEIKLGAWDVRVFVTGATVE